MEHWYTLREDCFSSFYYYDRAARELVRIRLELGREPSGIDDGDTIAIYHEHHYVGFTTNTYDNMQLSHFSLTDNGTILDNKLRALDDRPNQDLIVYDFSSTNKTTPKGNVHRGNSIANDRWAYLPKGIEQDDLEKLAERCLRGKSSIKLTGRGASERELAVAIRAAIELLPRDTEGTSGTATKPRCCRCTII